MKLMLLILSWASGATPPSAMESWALVRFATVECYRTLGFDNDGIDPEDEALIDESWRRLSEEQFMNYAKRPIDAAHRIIVTGEGPAAERLKIALEAWAKISPTQYLKHYFEALHCPNENLLIPLPV